MKILKVTGIAILSISLINCGTLLYPERQGQSGGRIDPAVAVLDGVGLLLFLIPGLVAFAIDFHQGTIYLPGSNADLTDLGESARTVKIEGPMTERQIEDTLRKELGIIVDLAAPSVQVAKRDTLQAADIQMARMSLYAPHSSD